jgi:hypothetical protein
MKLSAFAAFMNLAFSYKANGENKVDGKTPFKYIVTLKNGKQEFSCEYTKGAAHIKRRGLRAGLYTIGLGEVKKELAAVRYGEKFTTNFEPIPPTFDEVLECLHLDTTSIENAPIWEDWAAELGYNSDSMKDHAVYQKCMEQYLKLRKFFGSQFQTFVNCEHE